ncbi:hypothetical protein [Plesiomonas shigelloides]|uniref:hypothetical protein n=1 Tax=Plesiomonas shigelloides TaxID=703 RepID=UPI000A102388|nr:hypothetical protein [Plesiomonas shigelloides]
MQNNLKEIKDDFLGRNKKSDLKKSDAQTEKKTPHLAICHETNPAANNRHTSLMLKSRNLAKQDNFEEFCKSFRAMTDDDLQAIWDLLDSDTATNIIKSKE